MTNEELLKNVPTLIIPTRSEMWELSLNELILWQDTLQPYYLIRSDILRRYGISIWRPFIHYPFYATLIERRKGEIK